MDKYRSEKQKKERREHYRTKGSEYYSSLEYRRKNKEVLNSKNRKYYKKNKQEQQKRKRESSRVNRLIALEKCGGAKCVNCGCIDLRILELNYKDGGHCRLWKEGKIGMSSHLYIQIKNGVVDPKLFDVRCKVCNYAHFVKQKFNIDYSIKIKN